MLALNTAILIIFCFHCGGGRNALSWLSIVAIRRKEGDKEGRKEARTRASEACDLWLLRGRKVQAACKPSGGRI